MGKLLKKAIAKTFEVVEDIKKSIIGKLYLSRVETALRRKRPNKVITRYGYRFEVKTIDYVISTYGDNVVLGEYAGVYHKHNNTYIIGVDKSFRSLHRMTKRFIIEHEIAHITHDLHNPNNDIDIETQVDMIAASILGYTKKQLRMCLRDTRSKARYITSKKILRTRINNIK